MTTGHFQWMLSILSMKKPIRPECRGKKHKKPMQSRWKKDENASSLYSLMAPNQKGWCGGQVTQSTECQCQKGWIRPTPSLSRSGNGAPEVLHAVQEHDGTFTLFKMENQWGAQSYTDSGYKKQDGRICTLSPISFLQDGIRNSCLPWRGIRM